MHGYIDMYTVNNAHVLQVYAYTIYVIVVARCFYTRI